MKKDKDKSELIRFWWSKSEESLESAKLEFKAGSYSFAINRVYYAAFYAVCAALFDRQKSFKKHSGVRSAFHQEFIRSGLMEVKFGKFYDQLFEDRQEGDYVAFISFEPDYTLTLHKFSGFDFLLIMLLSAIHRENGASLFGPHHLRS